MLALSACAALAYYDHFWLGMFLAGLYILTHDI